MRKRLLILTLFLFSIFVSGCASSPGTPNVPGTIPAAYSDEKYTATIGIQTEAVPVTCKLVGATTIGGTLSLDNNCAISGLAPSTDNKKIIPFKVEITDANDVSNIHEMHLVVEPPPLRYTLPDKIEEASIGKAYSHSFCLPEVKKVQCSGDQVVQPNGGNSPYTFTISGQPLGLTMALNGVLSGTIKKGATQKDYNIKVCAKDLSGNQACDNTILKVTDNPTIMGSRWTGTFSHKYSTRVTSPDYTSNQLDEATFTFTVDKRVKSKGSGHATIIATDGCTGQGGEDRNVNIWYKYDESKNQFEFKVVDDSTQSTQRFDIQCGDRPYSILPDYFHSLYATPIYVDAEDGAITEANYFPEFDQSLATIEIHKVR